MKLKGIDGGPHKRKLNPAVKDFFDFDSSAECKDVKLIDYKHMGKIVFPIAQ